MVQAIQVELHKKPLHVSLISPGFVKTPLTDLNEFKMPFIMPAEKAALIIKKGLDNKKYDIHFPKRFSLATKFIMSLPQTILTGLLANALYKQKEP